MILAIDVGNTNIVVGCIDNQTKYFEGRLSTDKNGTVEEYAVRFESLLQLYHIRKDELEGGIISTVVTQLVSTLCQAVEMVIGRKPMLVGPGLKTGLNIKIDNPGQLGADLAVGAVASIAKYPLPQIVFDLGTATTASVIDSRGVYIGGAIVPGVKTALTALSGVTSQLPYVELTTPPKVIGRNTIDCMQSGSVYGTAAMIDGMAERIEEELGSRCTLIATGGIAQCILPHCKRHVIYDNNLLLDGLLIIYNKNK